VDVDAEKQNEQWHDHDAAPESGERAKESCRNRACAQSDREPEVVHRMSDAISMRGPRERVSIISEMVRREGVLTNAR
jgi:hypothetical protein